MQTFTHQSESSVKTNSKNLNANMSMCVSTHEKIVKALELKRFN